MRIYPSELTPVPLEPQCEDFRVVDVDDQCGQGVLALRNFPAGVSLFRMNGVLTTELTLHTLQLAPNLHLDDPYVAGKVLHSCAPNARLDVWTRLFIAERDIDAGELLTMDYEATEDVLFRPFQCCCGEANCRGFIEGRLLSTPAAVEELQRRGSQGPVFGPPLHERYVKLSDSELLDGAGVTAITDAMAAISS